MCIIRTTYYWKQTMICSAVYITLSLILFLMLSHSCNAMDCFIEGIPNDATSNGNLHTLRRQSHSLDLSLMCKCSLRSPKWEVWHLETGIIDEPILSPVNCVNGTNSCSPPTTYITQSNKSNGLNVYINYTFHITETSVVLSCYSRYNEKTVLVVTLEEPITTSTSVAPTPSSTVPVVTSSTGVVTSQPVLTTSSTVETTTSTASTVTETITSTSTVVSILSTCSSVAPTLPTVPSTDKDKTINNVDSFVEAVGGTSTVTLLPIVLILLIISTVFCGAVICMKIKHKERIKLLEAEMTYDRTRDSSNKDSSLDRLIEQSRPALPQSLQASSLTIATTSSSTPYRPSSTYV